LRRVAQNKLWAKALSDIYNPFSNDGASLLGVLCEAPKVTYWIPHEANDKIKAWRSAIALNVLLYAVLFFDFDKILSKYQ